MTEKNKVRFGLEKLHVAFHNPNPKEGDTNPAVGEGKSEWEKPIHIPGVVNFSCNPDGSESPFYADNIKFYTRFTNNGYTGDLETALIPDEIVAKMLGWLIDKWGGLVEDAAGKEREFALMFQVEGDKHNRRFVFYNCKANRPSANHATATESITPTTETLNVTMMSYEFGDIKTPRYVLEKSEENEDVYDAFFDCVMLPEFDDED